HRGRRGVEDQTGGVPGRDRRPDDLLGALADRHLLAGHLLGGVCLVPGGDDRLAPLHLVLVVGVPDLDRAFGLGGLVGRLAAAATTAAHKGQAEGGDDRDPEPGAGAWHGGLLGEGSAHSGRGGPVDARKTGMAGGSSMSGVARPSPAASSTVAAARPQAMASWRTVVSGGATWAARGTSSKPVTDRAPGTSRPRPMATPMPAMAMTSLA